MPSTPRRPPFRHGARGYIGSNGHVLEPKLKALPAKPGVYLFRDANEKILYVGKAKSLRSRVRSYFQQGGDARSGIGGMIARIADLGVIVTGTEVEALHLEQNLVKRHRPPFNVRCATTSRFASR